LDPQAAPHEFVSPDIHYADIDVDKPETILKWAGTTIDRLAIATSFQASGLVLLDMLAGIRGDLPVLFLNTGFHFPETLEFRDACVERWGLKLVDIRGEHGTPERQAEIYGPELYKRDPNQCCAINKVEPLQNALEEFDGWISGLRRDQSPMREDTPVVEAQLLPSGNEVLKIHPLAHWTRAQVDEYLKEHAIPTHPLLERGFASIGCWPCTRAIKPGEDERAGRWEGNSKTECGIHLFGKTGGPKELEAEE
jgi:phosphoadenosine phosphosulfate reductase